MFSRTSRLRRPRSRTRRLLHLLLASVHVTLLLGSDGDSAPWSWPVETPIQVSNPYRAPATRYSAGHRGIDLVVGIGRPIRAPADGVVHFAGRVVDRPVVSIDHSGVLSSFEPLEPVVAAGESVTKGQLIGTVGRGGHCDGRCLHLGARIDGEYVSPLRFLGGIPRAVLLPMSSVRAHVPELGIR